MIPRAKPQGMHIRCFSIHPWIVNACMLNFTNHNFIIFAAEKKLRMLLVIHPFYAPYTMRLIVQSIMTLLLFYGIYISMDTLI